MAGVSRSVTLVLAYLMKHFGLSYQKAHGLVLRKRNKVYFFLLRLILILDL